MIKNLNLYKVNKNFSKKPNIGQCFLIEKKNICIKSYSFSWDNTCILCKKSTILNKRSFYSCFYLGPFNPGQSITIANSLRRTLLSELTGFAITYVEIDGVTHEYSNIPGVKETVFDILLNIKEIVLKSTEIRINSFENKKKKNSKIKYKQQETQLDPGTIEGSEAYLQVRGPGIIRACDIKMPPFLVCVDPEQYIATLSEDGFLNMKLHITSGQNQKGLSNLEKKSYGVKKKTTSIQRLGQKAFVQSNKILQKSAEFHKVQSQFTKPIKAENSRNNLLFLDPVFMPVTKANFIIEQNPQDFSTEIIILEIWTNGSVHPRTALYESFKKLMKMLCFCVGLE